MNFDTKINELLQEFVVSSTVNSNPTTTLNNQRTKNNQLNNKAPESDNVKSHQTMLDIEDKRTNNIPLSPEEIEFERTFKSTQPMRNQGVKGLTQYLKTTSQQQPRR